MIWIPNWGDFDYNSGLAPSTRFEVLFCKEFFAIQHGIKVHEITIINGMKGIENIPINGIAFQSKYLKNWNWKQIKESLQNTLDERRKKIKPFDELKKIVVYVKEVNHNYTKDPIIIELQNEGIELEIFNGWEVIDTDPNYHSLKEYFEKDITYLSRVEYGFDCGIDIYYENRIAEISDNKYREILKEHQHTVNKLIKLLEKHRKVVYSYI